MDAIYRDESVCVDGRRRRVFEMMEELVRCRECSMYDAEDETCYRDPEHTGRGWRADPYGYCAWGERSEA